ncbi:MAG: Hsp70 family protein [Ardenticatenaceae bacterium]
MGKAIGIDLGTTNSVMAILDRGRPEVLHNRSSVKHPQLTPSVVGIGDDGRRLVGEGAKGQALLRAEDTIFSIKRFMGRGFADSDIQRDIEIAPYQVTENKQNGEAMVWMGGKPYSAPEISAFILESLKEQAEAQIGQEVTHAVITVPAYFGSRQKQATRMAGRLAGFEVMRLMPEPTAAALAYGIDMQSTRPQTILVYDLGGGTFDVNVFYLSAGLFTELARIGDNHLGGDDFDRLIINYIIVHAKEKHEGLSWAPDAWQKLKNAAEQAKILLSKRQSVNIAITSIAQDHHGRSVHINLPLTRPQYEKIIGPYVRQTIRLVERALQQAHYSPSEIDQLLLVGGSTLTPLVRASLGDLFGMEKVGRSSKIDPMECVALGAAIQTGILQPLPESQIESEDQRGVACPHCGQLNLRRRECRYCDGALGVTIGGAPLDVYEITHSPLGIQTVGDQMEVILDKGTYYPTEQAISRTFYTAHPNQSVLRIPVYEGVSKYASENEYQGVAEGELPPGLPAKSEVKVSFSIDDDCLLYVKAEVVERPNVKVEATIKWGIASGGASGSADWEVNAQKSLDRAASLLKYGQNHLSPSKIEHIEALMSELQQAISKQEQALAQSKKNELQQTIENMGRVTRWLIYAKYLLDQDTQMIPAESVKLRYLVGKLEQTQAKGQTSELNSVWGEIETFISQLKQRLEAEGRPMLGEMGLLAGA